MNKKFMADKLGAQKRWRAKNNKFMGDEPAAKAVQEVMKNYPALKLRQLGHKVDTAESPLEAVIETIPSPSAIPFCVRLVSHEFTSRCEVTGQPDFATIIIDYIPKDRMVESKSLKLYLHSFRNFNCFHERCVAYICQALWDAMQPHWIRVVGFFNPRGGISIVPYFCMGAVPDSVHTIHVPDVDFQPK